jgi:hypothetical protein
MIRAFGAQLGLACLYVVLAVGGVERAVAVANYVAANLAQSDELLELDLDFDLDDLLDLFSGEVDE